MKKNQYSFLIPTLILVVLFQFQTNADFDNVTGFSNPGTLNVFKYRPKGLIKKSPLVVVLHGCQQKAKIFAEETGWQMLAGELGLTLLLPEQTSGNNFAGCFTWFDNGDTTRDQGEVASIANAIDAVIQTDKIDSNRIFVTGLSAGAGMASALLANYPEKFKAGAIVAGVSYGCASNIAQSINCMFRPRKGNAETLGGYVREAAGSYKGTFPKVTIIHGANDSLVATPNASNSVSQWTNAHGVNSDVDNKREIADSNDFINEYRSGNKVVVESLIMSNTGHGWPVASGAGCGSTSQFVIETGVCGVRELAKSWGL